MDKKLLKLINKLKKFRRLTQREYRYLIENRSAEAAEILADTAKKIKQEIYGNTVFIRGLIEISNICKNDCLYCGIRKSNKNCQRYRLYKDDIIACAEEGYALGFRTFVLQGGEDGYYTDSLLSEIITEIKTRYPDCAVTLSLGERSFDSYKTLKGAGADRYLLRHETADSKHYSKLHPDNLSLKNRIKCLRNLKALGFQTGCGFMVGSPYQTAKHIAKDLKFIEKFKPDMCGIGPFIPHKDTPFKDFPSGSAELTCYLLSIIRIIHPPVLLPATTALGSISDDGRQKGILSGANVIMPNLSPPCVRDKYSLYNNKLHSGLEAAENLKLLELKMAEIGQEIVYCRGDIKL